MHYSIHHLTKFRYSAPITESVMELRMQPCSDGAQRCLQFDLFAAPHCRAHLVSRSSEQCNPSLRYSQSAYATDHHSQGTFRNPLSRSNANSRCSSSSRTE